ncbi:MAG: WD40 repeat domain-containing protein [Aggregatilineales bacterium]
MLKKLCLMVIILLMVAPALAQDALLSFTTEYEQIFGIAYSPDGSLLVASSFEVVEGSDNDLMTGLQLFDSASGEVLLTLETETHKPVSFAFSPDGTLLVTGAQNGEVALWDLETLETVLTFPAHETVPQILFSPDGTKMLTGDSSGIIVWDVETIEPTLVLSPQDIDAPQLLSVLVSPDNSLVTGIYAPDVLVFWDIADGTEILRQTVGYDLEPYAALFVPDETRSEILLAYADIEVRDVLDNSITATYDIESVAFVMRFSPDNSLLATADINDSVILWDAASQEMLLSIVEDAGFIHDMAFAPDGSVLTVAHGDGMISVFSLE